MPRHSSEAFLISALITTGDPAAAEKRNITPEMFAGYQTEYRWLLSYWRTYKETPTVEALKSRFPAFPFTETTDVRYSVDEVREDYNRRQLAKAIRESADHLRHGDMDSALLSWGGFSPQRPGVELVDRLADDSFLEHYESNFNCIATPWGSLTALTHGGMRNGDFWVAAARLGVGKSWTANEIAKHGILAGHRAIVYSMEMPAEQVHTRMHGSLAPVLGHDVTFTELHERSYSRSEYRALLADIRDNVPGQLFVVDQTGGPISPATLAAHADAADIHIVDYIGLMRSVDGTRAVDDWRVAAAISNQLKEVATSKNTRVFALSQINRDGDTSGWKPPKSKFLSQADAIGQDADVVLTMKRYSQSVMTYLLDKNRNGPAERYFWTLFDPDRGRFAEISRDRADSIKADEAGED